MAATQRIDQLISEKTFTDFEKLHQLVNLNVTAFEQLISKGVEVNNTLGKAATFSQAAEAAKALADNEKELVKQMATLQAANDKLTKQYQAQEKQIDTLTKKSKRGTGDAKLAGDLERAEKKLTDTYTAEARAIAVVKEQQLLANKANKLSAQETLGLVGAYRQLELEYTKAAQLAKDLAVQYGAGSQEAKEASAAALELDKRLKAADANVGRFNRYVGNYSGALKTLEKGLADTRKKQDEYIKSGKANADVIEQLQKEEKLLTTLLNSQAAGFATGTAEVKANTAALEALAAAGLKNTEVYNALFKATADLKDEVGDLKTALKNAAPDDVAFNAAADAARGLVGVYGLAKSASAVFGDENEALQETLVKLQAAETALQSIEAVRLLFKKESSVQQAIGIGLQKIEVLQTNLSTAAESKNIIVKYGAIAAQKILNAVMLANPILLIVGALALLVIALSSFSSAAEKAAVSFEGLNRQLEEENTLLDKNIQKIQNNAAISQAALSAQHAQQTTLSKDSIKFLESQKIELKALEERWFVTGEAAKVALKKFESRSESSLSDKEKEEKENAEKIISTVTKLQQDIINTDKELKIERIKLAGETADAAIKVRQAEIEIETIALGRKKAIYSTDADNAEKSYAARITAAQKASDLELAIINKKAKSQSLTPGQTPSELKVIEAERANAVLEVTRQRDIKLTELTKERIEREKVAQFEIARITIESNINLQQRIADDEDNNLMDRLAAQTASLEARENLIKVARDRELDNVKLLEDERKAISKKADDDLLTARTEFLDKVSAITLQNIQKQNDINVSAYNLERDQSIKALNERFDAGKLSLNEYNAERKRLEEGYVSEVLDIEIEGLQRLITEYKNQGKDITQLEAEVAAKQKEQSESVTQKKIADLEKVKEAQKRLGDETIETFKALVVASYDREKNKIQEQITALEEKKQKDIEVADRTILNEQDKAAAISVINIRAQAEKEALERRQKQLDIQKAKFEKALNVGKIVMDTARAVIAALASTPPNIPLSITVGVIGALQLARALATPIPTFEHGTKDAPGGLALVSEKRKELVITPDGRLIETPDTPTIMNIPKHSVILPDSEKALKAGITTGISRGPVLTNNDSHYKYMTDKLGGKIDALNATVKNSARVHIHPRKDGWAIMTRKAGNQHNYLNGNLQ